MIEGKTLGIRRRARPIFYKNVIKRKKDPNVLGSFFIPRIPTYLSKTVLGEIYKKA